MAATDGATNGNGADQTDGNVPTEEQPADSRDPSKRTAHQRQNLQRNWDPQLKMKNQMKCPNEMVERLPMTMTIGPAA